MATPVITSLSYSPSVPPAGYAKGTIVTVTMTYADADSTPFLPSVPAYTVNVTGTVKDQNGAIGSLQQTIQFAEVPAKPAYNDIDAESASFSVSDGRPVTLVSRDQTKAVFRFVA
jgi:hypothetical protein